MGCRRDTFHKRVRQEERRRSNLNGEYSEIRNEAGFPFDTYELWEVRRGEVNTAEQQAGVLGSWHRAQVR
jgi:hypothetical protein